MAQSSASLVQTIPFRFYHRPCLKLQTEIGTNQPSPTAQQAPKPLIEAVVESPDEIKDVEMAPESSPSDAGSPPIEDPENEDGAPDCLVDVT